MNYSLSIAAEGFMPSHAPLKNNKHLNILFSQLSPRKGKNKSESQRLTSSFWVHAYGTKGGGLGPCLYFVIMPDAAPDKKRMVETNIFNHSSLTSLL